MFTRALVSSSLLALILVVKTALADEPVCYSGCQAGATTYLFSNCSSTELSLDDFTSCQCGSVPYLGSMALCYANNCKSQAAVAWDYIQQDICGGLAANTEYVSTLNNATHYIVPGSLVNKTQPLYSTVLFSQAEIEPTFRTINEYNRQIWLANVYGGATNVVVLIFIIFGIINNIYNHLGLRAARSRVSKKKSIVSRTSQYLRKKFINPALFPSGLHSRQGRLLGMRVTIPTRIESIALAIFLVVNFAILFPNYRLFTDNTYWPDNNALQLCRYIADRTGIISFTQLPMVFLFSGKNNVMLYVTGWSYDRFTVAHKWISRTMFFHGLVHSIAYTVYPYITMDYDGWELYKLYASDLYFQYGVVATILGAFILALAMPTFRTRAYEFFLATHIFMVVFFMIGLWYHVEYIPLMAFMPWLYASVAIWSFDRFIRLVRLILLNIKLAKTGYQSCVARVLPEDCILLQVPADRPLLRNIRPGAYVYIYVPSISLWQSHPFTIAKWSEAPSLEAPVTESVPVLATDIAKTEGDRASSSGSSTSLTFNGPSFDLLIRPQRGLTAKLHRKILDNHKPLELNVIIEGPYGHTAPMDQYDTAIYITGGVGITASYPYLQKAVTKSPGRTRHIVFIWIIRTSQALEWIQEDLCKLLKEVDSSLAIDVEIYITQESQAEALPKPLINSIHFGARPNVIKRINEIVTVSPSTVAVLTCGPPGLNDEVRSAVSEEGIPYYEESFSW
ncbi:unnamed protein product [Umbelopsis ramanniana]